MADNLNDIIKGCVAGKLRAQEKLYKLFSKKMYGVCLLYTKDYSAAEDVLQDGFIRVYKNIDKFDHKGAFEGWMRRIMVNAALERYRKYNYLYPVEEIDDYIEEFSYQDVMSEIEVQDLMKIIHELSPKYRVAFCLYAIEGYSHQEISDELGISEGTSKSNLSRARKILQEKVLKLYEGKKTKPNLMVVDK